MRFHLDENVDHTIADGLRHRGVNVTTSTDAGLLTATDAQQLPYCVAEQRVILTMDRDMLVLAAQGVQHAGIAYWKAKSRTIGQVILNVLNLRHSLSQEEMNQRVEFI